MAKIFVARKIPDSGIRLLEDAGHMVVVSAKDGVLSREELEREVVGKGYEAIVSLLTDKIDGPLLDKVPTVRIVANYAVGYDNLDLPALAERNITATNTPGVLTNSVAEHAISLMLAVTHRIVESDQFMRTGKYTGWAPLLLLGHDMTGKTLGVLGLGRIGSRVASIAKRGFDMNVVYYDVARNGSFEKEVGATFTETPEELLTKADFVSVHVPLLPTTTHLIDAKKLALMKQDAVIVNTSRGPVIDEVALVDALRAGRIRGAGLDVFEHEPSMAPGLAELPNVVLTPHTASATTEARGAMSETVAKNLIEFFQGKVPSNRIVLAK